MSASEKPAEGRDDGTEWEVEEEDLEAAAKAGTPPRRAKLRIDRDYFTVASAVLTGREILVLAGKVPPEQFLLSQKLRGGQATKIDLNERVDLRTPGVERFMTLPKDQKEG
jgi:Multiubiquitin